MKTHSIAKRREQWLVVLLPAAIVLLVYSLFFFRPQQRMIEETRTRLEEARRSATTEAELELTRTRLATLQREHSRIGQQIREHRSAVQEILGNFGKNPERFAAMERIDDLLLQHDIVLVSQELIDQQKLSQRQRDVLRDIEQRSDQLRLEYRRLRLEGGYAEVEAFMNQLAHCDPLVLPVSLEAKKSDEKTTLDWVLVLVI